MTLGLEEIGKVQGGCLRGWGSGLWVEVQHRQADAAARSRAQDKGSEGVTEFGPDTGKMTVPPERTSAGDSSGGDAVGWPKRRDGSLCRIGGTPSPCPLSR